LFIAQFSGFIVWVLLGAAIVSGFLGEWIDTAAIIVIVILNALLGFIQEYRAEQALASLKKLSAPFAKVRRNGTTVLLNATQIVPGDILMIEAGDHIPADARLVESSYFQVQESSLTGESSPVEKNEELLAAATVPLADRRNMVYMGTSAVSGKAVAVVTAIGMRTELGKIAELIETARVEATPLQQRLARLSVWLVYFSFAIVGAVFILGLVRGESFIQMFLTSVSLAVAAIPEGLPAVVTIALALGVQRMVKRNALIRKLPSVETLGSTTVICTDKTGTLTKNEMTVTCIWTGGKEFSVTGIGYSPEGCIERNGRRYHEQEDPDLYRSLEVGVVCNFATLTKDKNDRWVIIGDPTEGALLTAASKGGVWKVEMEQAYRIIEEIPFDSQRKMMSIIARSQTGETIVFTKGAPDVVLKNAHTVLRNGQVLPLMPDDSAAVNAVNDTMGQRALRVLGVAYRRLDHDLTGQTPEVIESSLTFVGLIGMIDPPRPEARQALR
jgi:Ca2+-transporting ATPase